MIFIDLFELKVSSDWLAKAKILAKNVEDGKYSSASKFPSHWADIKDPCADLSANKCWYCEVPQNRSDMAVDHFRPKSTYPFLAYDQTNYRLACTFCNSPRSNPTSGEVEGKFTFFPLIEGSKIAKTIKELSLEKPMLLDPCRAADVVLLDFEPDGTPCARSKANEERVMTSIKLLHLNTERLNEERRKLGLQIQAWIDEADALWAEVDKGGNPLADKTFANRIDDIRRCLSPKKSLSRFASRTVRANRDKAWVETYFL